MDTETILNSVQKTGRCVVIQEGPRTCGVAAEIMAVLMGKALFHLRAPVERVTGFDTVVPLLKGEELYIPEEKRLTAAIQKVLTKN